MKEFIKSIAAFFLGLGAKAVIRRYRPNVVMVTGSVGKTSTKDAIAEVLATKFLVRKSEKSFNSEFGVPFTILGIKNPWSSIAAWFSVIKRLFGLLVLPNHYPNMLVLEVGADKPGDLANILKIVTPDAVVVTRLPDIPVHVEAYTSPEAVQEEEFSPAYALKAAAPLIIPTGKPHLREMADRTPARIVTYGEDKESTVRITHVSFQKTDRAVAGMQAHVTVCEEEGKLSVLGSVGKVQVLPAAAALATAYAFSIPLAEALVALDAYEPPPGRGRLFKGKQGSTVIDDSYNASPVAVEEALDTLAHFPDAKRRIAVLGDMLELGRYSIQEHERIGALASKLADIVITVGIRSRVMEKSAGAAAFIHYDDTRTAADALPGMIETGDVVLVKGSQSIRMERIVAALLEDPRDTTRLVRQEREWKRR